MAYEINATLNPLGLGGSYSLTAEQIQAAFIFPAILDPGNESKMRLAFKVFFFSSLLSEEDKAEVIHEVFGLVQEAEDEEATRPKVSTSSL